MINPCISKVDRVKVMVSNSPVKQNSRKDAVNSIEIVVTMRILV